MESSTTIAVDTQQKLPNHITNEASSSLAVIHEVDEEIINM